MNALRWSVPALLLLLTLPLAAEPLDTEEIAARLSVSTVTIRISNVSPDPGEGRLPPPADPIYLASGVSLGRGLIITFSTAPTSARFRATLPNGQQSDAELRVADDYSGLRLIEVPQRDAAALEVASEPPELGTPIMCAAAMGVEDPVVSAGIVGGVDHLLAGVELPPLLICDVRSTETSSGGPVVNRDGKLVGIVAATNVSPKASWAYAVPARHVARMVQAKTDNQLVVLRRQRPIAGFTLGPGNKEGVVRVDRVEPGGPADRAGIQPGNVLLEAEGRKIRSAYQAIDLILRKQPGDQVPLVVDQAGQTKKLMMTLAGTAAPASIASIDPMVQVGPQLNVRVVRPGEIEVRRGQTTQGISPPATNTTQQRDEAATLKALEQSIAQLKEEIRRRDQTQADTNKLIESMTDEISRLRKRLEEKR